MKTLLIAALVLATATFVTAQKIEKPTLTPKPCTDEQSQMVREGITLHDAKKYPDAVAKYEEVIAANPDCTLVIYELSMTYYAMGQKTKAMETAYRGSKYKSDDLPLFYLTMANCIDDVGKPEAAVKIYQDAIKMLEGDKDMVRHLSSVHYNLGVTLIRQKKLPEARVELKKAIEYNYQYASPHYLLARLYSDGKYKVPAFLAAARFLSLELTSQRSQIASQLIRQTLAPAQKDDKGSINIFLDMNAPKDEGDFTAFEMFLGTLAIVQEKDGEKKTEEQKFVGAVGTLIALVAENKDVKKTFVGKQYVPFLAEAKRLGYSEVIGYLVLHHTGSEAARGWLTDNEAKLKEFVAWSKAYTLPK